MSEQSASSHLAVEVASQPDLWADAAARAPGLADRLPPRGARLAVVGCGTSWFVAQAYAAQREERGHGETDAFTATELPLDRPYDAVLHISRSGTTTEVIAVAEALRGRTPTYAVVATPETPLLDLVDHAVVLPDMDERSVVQTRFATSVLALLRASVGDDLRPAIEQARAVLAEDESTAVAPLVGLEQITFLGTGWTIGPAHEAALKLRESTQSWTESYSAMEYRHGPISIATTGRAVWVLGDAPAGLAADVAATGARLEHRPVDALAELVRVHRLCLARAAALGLDPDRPRHLTRSVILDATGG
ncbi:SIS domain-containing protein [Luteipulveratus sp. YIM 133132]|uniref:SIS domain-containing protein n=1 Tax=Luteipulveratus flavus TaxID=3031728 RepID=UPI0023B0E0BE|nr:SIS domain-containing protein [Luteipulveratus sp. YIM 133132]MDE9365387.1 SIS domain-containing protein [Luteipulveratus sp. YIM 133132]